MFGKSAFNVTNNFPPGGPPFVAAAAENGLSVDPVTGKIVLGNDVGAVGDPAQLLSPREIKLNNQFFEMVGPVGIQFLVDASGVFGSSQLTSDDLSSSVVVFNAGNGSQANLEANSAGGVVSCSAGSDGINGHFNINATTVTYFLNFINALTNHAAAAVGTLNNAPVAGNPTKWIAIRDNGVVRRIPTW